MKSKNIQNTLIAFIQTFPALLAFEVVYKILCSVLLKPLLSFIMQIFLNLSGYSLAFNERILNFFTNIPGVITLIIMLALGALMVYYEFSVIILMLYHRLHKNPIRLGTAMKMALTTYKSLENFGSVGFTAYALGLPPLIHIGLRPSLLPQTRIPNFITGELSKTLVGNIGVYLFYVVIFVLFVILLFVLPAMVLDRVSFMKASRRSFSILKKGRLPDALALGIYLILWIVLFNFPGFVPTYFPGISGNGPFTVFLSLFSGNMFAPLMGFLLAGLLRVTLMLLLLTILTAGYSRLDGRVNIDGEALPFIDERLGHTKEKAISFFHISRHTAKSAWTHIKAHPFFIKHQKPIALGVVILAAVGMFSLFYNPPALHSPIVIGHRGSSEGVENTLGSIQGGIDQGADYAEIDILLSKDNVPMVIHDSNLQRLSGENVNVYDLTAKELGELTLFQNDAEGKISTLEEVIRATKGQIKLLIELKTHGHETADVAAETAKVVEAQNDEKNCMFMSLDYSLVEQLKTLHPEYTVGYCVYGNLGKADTRRLVNMDIDFLTVEENMVTKSLISKARKAWLPVYVWTVDEPKAMRQYLDLGVLGLITDKPAAGREVIDQQNP